MKPYSKDLRLKVLEALDRGMPRTKVVEVFGVSVPTIKRWLRRQRETGNNVEPKPIPGPPARKGVALEEALPSQLRANPDFTLEEHRELFEETSGISVSASSISRAFKPGFQAAGVAAQKKTLFSSERDEEERAAFRRRARAVDPKLLVWVDECGTHTSMTRLFTPGLPKARGHTGAYRATGARTRR